MNWPSDITEAKKIQDKIREKVRIIPLKKIPRFVAGVDAAFMKEHVIGVACLYEYPRMVLVTEAFSVSAISFPYVPGFLSFREGPVIIAALKGLKRRPDVILFDGQGIAHPKGVGIASHVGVLLNISTIGCAKSRLVGDYREPASPKGLWSPLVYKGRVVGAVLRTKDHVKPVFVSPGHMITLDEAIEITLHCSTGYRIPNPLRKADHIGNEIKKSLGLL